VQLLSPSRVVHGSEARLVNSGWASPFFALAVYQNQFMICSMSLEPTLFYIGNHAVGLFEFIIAVAAMGIFLLFVVLILAWRAQSGRKAAQLRASEMEYRLAELSGVLQNFSAQAQGQQMNLQRTLDERLDQSKSARGLRSQRTNPAHRPFSQPIARTASGD
jgi:hypothetical protein